MTSRELIRWSQLHERRSRSVPVLVGPILIGAALAAWVWWRGNVSVASASHAWLAGAVLAFAVAFMRVPFHIYWRSDAPLLAQLPLEGRPLFDAALARCWRAAQSTTIATLIGALPLLATSLDLALRHAAYAVALGLAAALLIPGVTVGAAALVVQGDAVLKTATALGGAPVRTPATAAPTSAPPSPGAILGALPGFVASIVIVAVLYVSAWLTDSAGPEAPIVLAALAAVSVAAILAARAGAGVMARVLRDVSALDRQRLATLEIRPPTALEQVIASLIGRAALPYRKDARLVRRRYPMAFALGALIFLVLVVVGIAQPADPTPWLTVAIGGAASYALVLEGRLRRPPIELARLSATLPLGDRERARAKRAWLLGWWLIFVAAPGVFAALRQTDPTIGLALAGAATLVIVVAGALRR
jgi:hypothetical protein